MLVSGRLLAVRPGGRDFDARDFYSGFLWQSWAWSVDNKDVIREEPVLKAFAGWRLVNADPYLYLMHPESGQMVQIEQDTSRLHGGTLSLPRAAEAPYSEFQKKRWQSGLPINVGGFLVVLCAEGKHDLAYNPQQDEWIDCGQAQNIKPGSVVAHRSGDSPRLWLAEPDVDVAVTLT